MAYKRGGMGNLTGGGKGMAGSKDYQEMGKKLGKAVGHLRKKGPTGVHKAVENVEKRVDKLSKKISGLGNT